MSAAPERRAPDDAFLIGARLVADSLRTRVSHGEAGRVWADMPIAARVLLLEIVAGDRMQPEVAARQPWAAFPPEVREEIGLIARTLHRNLAGAEALR